MDSDSWDYLSVSARLRQALELVPGASVDAKSKALGFSAPSVYSYLSGKNKFPLEFMIKLQMITNISFDWLLTGEGNQFKSECPIQRQTIDSDYFELVRGAVDDLVHSEKCEDDLSQHKYFDFIVYAYNIMINKLEGLDFDRVLLTVMPSLKNKLSAIKEIRSLRPDVFRRFDRDSNDLYTVVTPANDLLSAFEGLLDKKLNDFAKANNLAPPPKSEK